MPNLETPKPDIAKLRIEVDALYADLLIGINKTLNAMPKAKGEEDIIVFVGRKFLFDTAILCREIIRALDESSVYLGTIGTKTLIEILINTKYIFIHPHINSDPGWVEKLCKEYRHGCEGDDDRLNGKSVSERGRAVPPGDALNTYRGVCKIAHATRHTRHVVVGNEDTKNDFANDVYIIALVATINTHWYIAGYFKAEQTEEYQKRITELIKRYPQRVI